MPGAVPRAGGLRPIRRCRERTGCSRRPASWTGAALGFGMRDSGLGIEDSGFDARILHPDSRPSCSSANDARAGETIVEPAIVAAEQRRDETEARRYGQQEP